MCPFLASLCVCVCLCVRVEKDTQFCQLLVGFKYFVIQLHKLQPVLLRAPCSAHTHTAKPTFYDMKQVRNTSQDVCCGRLVQAMFPIVFNSARSRHSIACYPQYARCLGWYTHQGVPFNTFFFTSVLHRHWAIPNAWRTIFVSWYVTTKANFRVFDSFFLCWSQE